MDRNTENDIVMPRYATAVLRDEYAFRRDITGVRLHDMVTYIGDNAFAACTGLKNIDLPDSLEYIGAAAFGNCTGLESVRIPGSVNKIPEFAFSGCTGLKSLQLPEGLSGIGEYAFSGCVSLDEVVIPASVKSLPWSAFSGCRNLKLVYDHEIEFTGDWYPVPDAVQEVIAVPDGVRAVGTKACQGAKCLRKLVIPSSVAEIKDGAFSACPELEQVIIRNLACRIHSRAFVDCPKLRTITYGDNSHADAALTGCVIDNSTLLRYEGTADELTLPEGLEKIAENAFKGCVRLKKLTVPSTVKELGGRLFYGGPERISITFAGTAAEWEKMMPDKRHRVNKFIDDGYHHGHGEHISYIEVIPVMHTGNPRFECFVYCQGDGNTLLYSEAPLPPVENGGSYNDGWR